MVRDREDCLHKHPSICGPGFSSKLADTNLSYHVSRNTEFGELILLQTEFNFLLGSPWNAW